MLLVDFLRSVKDLISTPRKWTKNSYESDDGHRHCLIGAITAIENLCGQPGIRKLSHAALNMVSESMIKYTGAKNHYSCSPLFSIPAFNDHYKTRHRDVMKVLDMAIEKAETQGFWSDLRKHTKRIPKQSTKKTARTEAQEFATTAAPVEL